MARLRDTIERTTEYTNFINSLKEFHNRKGTTLQAEPVLGGKRLDLYKIYHAVIASGGFDEVTKNRGWKQVGDIFQFPSTCTNSAYILKGVYIRNLLGYEEENIWQKTWEPPKELLGPHAHRASTLAGKTYKAPVKGLKKPVIKSTNNRSPEPASPVDISSLIVDTLTALNHTITPTINACSVPEVQHTTNIERRQSIKSTNGSVHFDKETKDKILFALRFGQRANVEWALDFIVSLSFESPESLNLTESPYLLDLLLSLAQPCLTTHAVDHILPSAKEALMAMLQDESKLKNSATANILLENISASSSTTLPLSSALSTLDLVLKVFHILRNFSFLPSSIPLLISNKLLKDILVQGLETSMSTGHFELGRHSIDVIENLSSYTILQSEQDPYLLSLYRLALTQDRYLIIGSIRTLTLFFSIESNKTHLKNSPIMDHATQMLLSSDEELVGTALEYIYQYTCISEECRASFISKYANFYLGLFVSLLLTKSKYFNARTVHGLPNEGDANVDFDLFEVKKQDPLCAFSNTTEEKGINKETNNNTKPIPTVPDLTVYHNLDEPFRCLGWLKDKFEAADRSSVLSLDDIYLLYEARFGLEKALKMRDFYTVMKIAFPKASTSESKPLLGSPGKAAPVVEGLNIVGIQIKMSILQDRPAVLCKWDQCSLSFDDTFLLQRHLLQSHLKQDDNQYICRWNNCFNNAFEIKDDVIAHLRTHFYNVNNESCCPSPILNNSPSEISSIPSTPTSPSSSVFSAPDLSEVQGIALVAIHLLLWISRDSSSPKYFIPFEKEMILITEQRPKLSSSIWSILLNLKLS